VDNILLALRVVVSLAVVIGAIWFVQRRVSRGGARTKRAGKPMSVIARQNLGPKASVAVVEFGGKRFLLGVTEHGIAVLDNSVAEELATVDETASASVVAPPSALTTGPVAVTRRASSKQNSRDFAQALGQATEATPLPKPAPVRLARNDTFNATFPQSSSKLAGSIFSATTWKQAWIAVRGRN
jgi:flagellar protein FliO/FliZ